ncbi:MAG: hypothetical protein C0392_01030 [Syntrophus sp. (in: bacteria)]|nr:hypothetical protein [Syntrophus sp. (in: bacteria)]
MVRQVITFLCLLLFMAGCDPIQDAATPLALQNEVARRNAKAYADKFKAMSPTEHLKQAQALSIRDPETIRHLKAIPNDAPERLEADKIVAQIKKGEDEDRKEEAKRKREQAVRDKNAPILERQRFAKEYEHGLLKQMMDVHVSTTGKEHNVLKIRYVLMNRPLVYNLWNNEDYKTKLIMMGFEKLICTDGYDNTWSIKLK